MCMWCTKHRYRYFCTDGKLAVEKNKFFVWFLPKWRYLNALLWNRIEWQRFLGINILVLTNFSSKSLQRVIEASPRSARLQNLPKALKQWKRSKLRPSESGSITCIAGWMHIGVSSARDHDAQFKAKQFSSRKYTSHQWVPELLARQLGLTVPILSTLSSYPYHDSIT